MQLVEELDAFFVFIKNDVKEIVSVLELKLKILFCAAVEGGLALKAMDVNTDLVQQNLLLCQGWLFIHEDVGSC